MNEENRIPEEYIVNEGNETGVTMDYIEQLIRSGLMDSGMVLRVPNSDDTPNVPRPEDVDTGDRKRLFKGIKQVTFDEYESLTEEDRKQYVFFVRESSGATFGFIGIGNLKYTMVPEDIRGIDCGFFPVCSGDTPDTGETPDTGSTTGDTGSTTHPDYLTFNITSDGEVCWAFSRYGANRELTIEYSMDDCHTWTSIESSERSVEAYPDGGTKFNVHAGDTVYFRGLNGAYNGNSFTGTTAEFTLSGNILSLTHWDDFEGVYDITENNAYTSIFNGCTGLTSAEELKLLATGLTDGCYSGLFSGCISLETPPVLPATILSKDCYSNMFYRCTSLNVAPNLPAETLAENCYSSMFGSCSSLSTAPELPATELENGCYKTMFQNSGIVVAPELPATVLKTDCYKMMFYSCRNLIQMPELPANTMLNGCYQSMFEYCTSLVSAVNVLPAENLAASCYKRMFANCTSLTNLPELPATFGENSSVGYVYSHMFENCTSVEFAQNILPTLTLTTGCYEYMFAGCTSLVKSPILPSYGYNYHTVDRSGYYNGMFKNCSNLQQIECYAGLESLVSRDSSHWVEGVHPTGIFITNESNLQESIDAVPIGWTILCTSYLTFTANTQSTISISNYGGNAPTVYYYRNGDSSFTEWDYTPISLEEGDCVMMYGDNTSGFSFSDEIKSSFNITGNVKVGGNIMSLLYRSGGEQNWLIIPNDYCFYGLFSGCTAIIDVSDLILSATQATNYCYSYMFAGCTSLVMAMQTIGLYTVKENCCVGMFMNCRSLSAAPELPATSLMYGFGCYSNMFYGCRSLVTPPELPATTLAEYCYSYMFYDCRALTTAPELPAEQLAVQCYANMFNGCTSLTTAPELPARTLDAFACYRSMFYGCSNLTYIKALFETITANTCLGRWVEGVSATGTFVKSSAATWDITGISGIPEGWTVEEV